MDFLGFLLFAAGAVFACRPKWLPFIDKLPDVHASWGWIAMWLAALVMAVN